MKTTLTSSLLLWVLILMSCSGSGEKEGKDTGVSALFSDEPVKVKVMQISKEDFSHELISNGTIVATQKADLRFETSSEVIKQIYVKNGNKISKGQKIAELDQFKLKNSVSQTKDNLEKARLELQDILIGQGYTLRDSVNIPQDVMKIARIRSNFDNSLAQYELAVHNLERSVLYAPFDGVVANLFSKEYNQPPVSDAFCTIISNNRLEVDFMILESELSFVSINDKVKISPFSINDYTINGQIIEINPVVDKNGMVRVKASVAGQRKNDLYDGMNVNVRIQRSINNQLVIPKTALVLRTNKKVVFTLKKGKAVWNYVQTGIENSDGYIITEGLNVGDSVIYDGNLNLAHESPVQMVE